MGAFKKAVKKDLKLRLAITGPAGSGKTYTALRIATAMGLSIAFIDTEHGSASKYSDIFDFDVMEMRPPFNPERFVRGIQIAAQEGYKVVIIDSLSHAWNGTGGILEMVEEAAARLRGNSYAAWKDVTPVQNLLVETIVGSDIHIIATMRSKMEYAQQKDDKGVTKIQKMGMAPIQRDGFEYEFDIVMDMDIHHNGIVSKTRCPALTDKVFKFPGEEVARILTDWLGSGSAASDIAAAKAAEPKLATPHEEIDFPNKTERKAAASAKSKVEVDPQSIDVSDGPDNYEHDIISQWETPLDAKAWAMEINAVDNLHHAEESWKKSVMAMGGFSPKNAQQVYLHFLRRQFAKIGKPVPVPA